MGTVARNAVRVSGVAEGRPMVFVHGFGCDQAMWRFVAPDFEVDHRVVLLDLVGAGNSDLSAYDPAKYDSLDGYADDIVEICRELELRDVVLVGHSVSAMIGVLAAQRAPELFGALVMVGPNPRYVDDGDYVGGFSRTDIAGLLDALDANHLGWSTQMAPVIMGNPEHPELAEELTNSFCRTDPGIAAQFARVTFLSDNRGDLPSVAVPSVHPGRKARIAAVVSSGALRWGTWPVAFSWTNTLPGTCSCTNRPTASRAIASSLHCSTRVGTETVGRSARLSDRKVTRANWAAIPGSVRQKLLVSSSASSGRSGLPMMTGAICVDQPRWLASSASSRPAMSVRLKPPR